ncbi:hypothetical protein KFK09_009520 [Dendrobium nobile]|uniref:Uncharacterized protein n=1 Tax=Dendrobium nobile TaxID=94219 RepID=A0A8T3BN06_DENNO|nr:hypothetical protein KFK09_009520 [Dendrobium nobile]
MFSTDPALPRVVKAERNERHGALLLFPSRELLRGGSTSLDLRLSIPVGSKIRQFDRKQRQTLACCGR